MPQLTAKLEHRSGWEIISQEAFPSLTSNAKLFTTVPSTAKFAIISVRGNPIVVSFDGTDATTSVGIDFPVGTYTLDFDAVELAKIEAIQNGGTATGYIVYGRMK